MNHDWLIDIVRAWVSEVDDEATLRQMRSLVQTRLDAVTRPTASTRHVVALLHLRDAVVVDYRVQPFSQRPVLTNFFNDRHEIVVETPRIIT